MLSLWPSQVTSVMSLTVGLGKDAFGVVLVGVCKLSKRQFTLVSLGQAIPLLKIHLAGRLAHFPHPRHLQGWSLCVVCIHKRLKTSYRPTNKLLKKKKSSDMNKMKCSAGFKKNEANPY